MSGYRRKSSTWPITAIASPLTSSSWYAALEQERRQPVRALGDPVIDLGVYQRHVEAQYLLDGVGWV